MVVEPLKQAGSTMIRTFLLRGAKSLLRDTTFRRLLSNSGWLLSANTVSLALAFVQGVIVARALGVERYGVLALITTYATTVNQFVDSRVWEAAIKFVTQYREKRDLTRAGAVVKLCYWVDAATGSLAFVILIVTAGWAARLFVKDESTAVLIQFYALSILVAVPVGTSSALLRIGDQFDWLAYQDAGMAILKLVGVIVVALAGWGIIGVLSVYLLAAAAGMVALVVLSRRVGRQLGLGDWEHAALSSLGGEYKHIFRFMIATNASAFFKLLQRNADVLLIGYWLTPSAAGYFRLARSMTDLMQFPVGPLYTASYPEFARLWHRGKVLELSRLVRKLTLSSTAVALAALCVMGFGARWIIQLSVGSQYLPALPVLLWLAFGVAMAVATNFGHPLLLAIGRATSSLLAIALGVVCQMAILVFLLPVTGIAAAGIAYLGFYLIWVMVVALATRIVWSK